MINDMRGTIDGYLEESKREKRSSEMGSYHDDGRNLAGHSGILKPPAASIYENSASKN